jgi:hypothetical protein
MPPDLTSPRNQARVLATHGAGIAETRITALTAGATRQALQTALGSPDSAAAIQDGLLALVAGPSLPVEYRRALLAPLYDMVCTAMESDGPGQAVRLLEPAVD